MANDVFDFLWNVPSDGYQWVDAVVPEEAVPGARSMTFSQMAKTKKAVVLTDRWSVGASYMQKQYNPLRMYPALFRVFAEVEPTKEAIQQFANKYGNLGLWVPISTAADPRPSFLAGMRGETLWEWTKSIFAFRRAVKVWDMVHARDVSGLSHYIKWKEDKGKIASSNGELEDGAHRSGSWIYASHPEGSEPSEDFLITVIDPVLDLFKPGDLLMPAQFLVQRWINDHLKVHVSPKLLYNLDHGKPMLRIVPKNLLGAMWLQLAQSIDGNRQYRTCKQCGAWFEVSSDVKDGRTARRVFCSEKCKSRDYRQRKDLARQLRKEKKPIKEIAQTLDTDAATIKKWLSQRD